MIPLNSELEWSLGGRFLSIHFWIHSHKLVSQSIKFGVRAQSYSSPNCMIRPGLGPRDLLLNPFQPSTWLTMMPWSLRLNIITLWCSHIIWGSCAQHVLAHDQHWIKTRPTHNMKSTHGVVSINMEWSRVQQRLLNWIIQVYSSLSVDSGPLSFFWSVHSDHNIFWLVDSDLFLFQLSSL